MTEILLCNRRTSGSAPRLNGVYAFLFAVGLAAALCGLFAARNCDAQAANQDSNQQPYSQADRQSGQSTDLESVSANQIIDLLRQEPEILATVKMQAAQQSGADPSSIDDETVFERLRLDPDLRDLATKDLTAHGFIPGAEAPNRPARNPANASSTKEAAPQAAMPAGAPARPYEEPDEPRVQHRLSPYPNLPSLGQLYSQFPSTEAKLRRFGSDTFVLGTGNANQLPMDLPAGPDYVLGPGDSLLVNMWGGQSSRLDRPIDRQGQIALPEAGAITIAGLTIAQAQVAIQKALGTQFQNEHVEISLGRVRTVRVYVVGDVQRPGAYDVSSLSTPLNALYAAGGPTSNGSLRTLRQLRGKQLVREIDLYDFLLHGVRSEIDRLQPGDTLLVPPVGPQISVGGMVRRPAIYELKGEQGLNEVLDLAGGVLVSASLKQIRVERIEAHQRRTMLSVQLPEGQDGAAQQTAAFRVQDGDSVLVSQILPFNEQMVYLDGHVFRPGKYPMSQGMTVAALVRMAGGFKRSAFRDEADLSSYTVEDGRKVLLNHSVVAVQKALDGDKSADAALKPGDVVSIRQLTGWADIGAAVAIAGEVGHPGVYGIQTGERLSSLLKRAGGFRETAYPAGANLERAEVRRLGEQARQEMIRRIETTPITFNPGLLSGQDQANTQQAMQQQRDQVLVALRNHPASGRQVIRISSDIAKWENTPADIEMRPGDTLVIPKRENFVLVNGQVYNQTAITYAPGKDGSWYLRQAGGVTQSGDKGRVYVIRANGSVAGHASSWATGNSLSLHMRPGDIIVVPEKTIGSQVWKNLISAAQIMASVAVTGSVTGMF